MKKDKVRKNFFNDLCVLLSLFKEIAAKALRLTSKIKRLKSSILNLKSYGITRSQLVLFAQCIQQCYE